MLICHTFYHIITLISFKVSVKILITKVADFFIANVYRVYNYNAQGKVKTLHAFGMMYSETP